MRSHFFHRIGLVPMLCLVLMVMSTRGVSEELEAESTEENDRYARVEVTVDVDDNTYETRKVALNQAKEKALILWRRQ